MGVSQVGMTLNERCFTSYTGIKLPLKLVNELDDNNLDKRITYFKGYYDTQDRLAILEKVVYGEVEFSHHYEYSEEGVLKKAILVETEELPRTLVFDEQGHAIEA